MSIRNDITVALKGFGMGAANVVPGVSGGTIALITGIYSEIVDALNSLTDISTWKALLHGNFKEFWAKVHGRFILALGIGVIISIFSLAKAMTWALETHPILTWAFFFGLILASSWFMLRDVKGWKWGDVAVTAIGIVLGLVVCTLSPAETPDDMWFIFICAAIAICTMILPGISGSFILMILSKYDYIMQAVSDLNWPVLAVFAAGCVVGLLAFAKLLHWLLEKWERQTMLLLVGFVLGSLIKVWPWHEVPAGTSTSELHIAGAIIFCISGAALVIALELPGRKSRNNSLGKGEK